MSASHTSDTNEGVPSTPALIRAWAAHQDHFEFIATHPQAGIYERFGSEYALATAYLENKVHRCAVVAWASILEKSRSPCEEDMSESIQSTMDGFVDTLLLHRGCASFERCKASG